MAEQKEVFFELRIPKTRELNDYFNITLKDIDEPTYIAAINIIQKNPVEGNKFLLRNLWVEGDPVEDVINNFFAFRCCDRALAEIVTAPTVELKKK